MQFSHLLFLLAALLAPLALLSTTWLYLYPIFHGCAFPIPPPSLHHKYPLAPFRLLALGDPQLEGDSSLPDPNAPIFPSLTYLLPHLENAESNAARVDMLREAGKGVVQDAGKWLEGKRKAVDLWGNDRYLAHIVRMVRWWTEPSHVAVLGDLLGSQWVTDGEFEKRAGRYWEVVMRGLEMVPRRVFGELGEEVSEGVEDVPNEHDSKIDGGEVRETKDNNNQDTHAVADDAVSQGEKDEEKREEVVHTSDANEINDADAIPRKSELEMAIEAEEKLQQQIWADNNDDVDQVVEEMKEAQEEAEASEIANTMPADTKETHTEENPEEGHEEDTEDKDDKEEQKATRKPLWGGTTEVLGADVAWKDRVINIAGNHDVGYAGDLDDYRIERFEKAFGSVNWDIWFKLPSESTESDAERSPSDTSSDETAPALRLVVLNSMNLDTPAWNSEMQSETYKFMNHIITTSRSVEDKTHATILLTHIPLEKQPGICVDSPFFNFYDEGQGVREQNMLSDFSSKTILENIYGMSDNMFAVGEGLGRRGIILNGHDHAGCDVTHFIRQNGVFDACDPLHVHRKDAHWPAMTSTSTTTTTSSSTTMSVPTTYETSPANPFIQETSPVPIDSSPSQDEDTPEPEIDPALGWRAHRFPHRPYSITHYPHTNTTSCTSIDRSPHIREITLRSMMGEFSGYAGFLSAWFDPTKGAKGEWVFEFSTCGVGIQHWWWAVHIIDVVLVVLVVAGVAFKAWEGFFTQSASMTPRKHMNGNGQTKRKT